MGKDGLSLTTNVAQPGMCESYLPVLELPKGSIWCLNWEAFKATCHDSAPSFFCLCRELSALNTAHAAKWACCKCIKSCRDHACIMVTCVVFILLKNKGMLCLPKELIHCLWPCGLLQKLWLKALPLTTSSVCSVCAAFCFSPDWGENKRWEGSHWEVWLRKGKYNI